jgi:hypothetical protein
VETNVVEVETAVCSTSVAWLQHLEVFLASYLSPSFTNAVVLTRGATGPLPVAATPDRGEWQMYLRDIDARSIADDGRWKLEPHPVNWRFPREFAGPAATVFRRAPGLNLTATLSADATGCFAVALPHETESHYSVYFSLFGADMAYAKTLFARVRLELAPAAAAGR